MTSMQDYPIAAKLQAAANWMRKYHDHQVSGLEHIPDNGPCLLAIGPHSLATYDGFLLGLAIHHERQRLVRALGDRLIFRLPGLKHLAPELGIVEAEPTAAADLLDDGEVVAVVPGGMREALRPSQEAHQLRWDDRQGFIRLALDTGAPLVLAACAGGDEIYDVFANPVTETLYQTFKIPMPLARGRGWSLLPKPAKVVHKLAPAQWPEQAEAESASAYLRRCHQALTQQMQDLIQDALAERDRAA